MSDDLEHRIRMVAGEASPRPGAEAALLRRARARRRLTLAATAVAALVLAGGVTGAATLLGDRDATDIAPRPDATAGCMSPAYDVAVLVAGDPSEQHAAQVREQLLADERVADATFVSAGQARAEYLAANPDHDEGQPLPTGANTAQFRLQLTAGADPHRASKDLAEIGDGAIVPAAECPPGVPEAPFARYFFEVAKGNASASGVMEVNWKERTACIDAQFTGKIVASHLLYREPQPPEDVDGAASFPAIMLTFFEPNDERLSAAADAGVHCLRGPQLDGLEPHLYLLINEPQRFSIDFHRGPNDEPGLVARLVPPGMNDCAAGPRITKISRRAEPRQRVAFAGECFVDPALHHDDMKVFLVATLLTDGTPAKKHELGEQDTCELRALVKGATLVPEDGDARGWFAVPETVTCSAGAGVDKEVLLRPGRYKVAFGCPACVLATVRIADTTPGAHFDSIPEAVDYLADQLDVEVALPSPLPPGARLDPRRGAEIFDDAGGRWGRLTLRFGDESILGLDFGSAGFDGCGGDGAVGVEINGTKGLMLAKDRYPWTQIIWPATRETMRGTYGVYGSLPSDQMLELARSMDLNAPAPTTPIGC